MKRFLTGCLVLIMLLFTGCKFSKTTGSLEQKEINSEKSCFSGSGLSCQKKMRTGIFNDLPG